MNQLGIEGIAFPPQADDYIATPPNVTRVLLNICPPPKDCDLVDPGAGGGAILQVLIEDGWDRDRMHAVEIRREEYPHLTALHVRSVHLCSWMDDYVDHLRRSVDVGVVANPPFSKLPSFAESCFEQPKPYVAHLMPVDEVAGKQVSSRFFKRHPPTDIIPIPWRPWGRVRGVAWFIWLREFLGRKPQVHII